MSETGTLTVKKDHTRRFLETAALEGGPANLTGKELRMVLVAGAAVVTLTVGSGMGITSATAGTYWWEVTVANLSALANPSQIIAYLTIYNADNSVFMEDQVTLNVGY
jgi:hypothetical protein